jgi:hypothetical protein
MLRKPPETCPNGQIAELNWEFLRLVARSAPAGRRQVFGLDPGLVDRIAALSDGQRHLLASTPCLLAELPALPQHELWSTVADAGAEDDLLPVAFRRDVQMFAASMLTYVSQVSRRNRLLTHFCVGLNPDLSSQLSRLSFSEIRQHAENAALLLQARLARHPRFWPDLLQVCASQDSSLQALARLTIVQLTVAQHWPPRGGRLPEFRGR